jgi:hypothetical protein
MFSAGSANYFIDDRDIPAQEANFTIAGGTWVPVPAVALFIKRMYLIRGVVHFTPQSGHNYTVKGRVGESYCGVWIEDAATGDIMGRKIEYQGASYSSKWDGRIVTTPAP